MGAKSTKRGTNGPGRDRGEEVRVSEQPDARPGGSRTSTRVEASRRRRQEEQDAAAERRRRTLLVAAGAALLVLVLVVAGIAAFRRSQEASAAIPEGTQTFSYVGNQHTTEPVAYAEHPPVGGAHNPVWQDCGFYEAPIANETAVHSLEHGAVWITYRPDLPAEQREALRARAEDQSFILVSPMADLPSPVVASAWGRQLQLESATDERLDQFVNRFRLSRDAPEPGAACTGGTAATV
jgi:hypothetical protein